MTLYVVTQPDPPPGRDFTFVVPGRYLYDVTGITATLDTDGTQTTTALDASGNGNNGTYAGILPPRTYVPGLVAGDLALDFGSVAHPEINASSVDFNPPPLSWLVPWSVEIWYQYVTPSDNVRSLYVMSSDEFSNNYAVWGVDEDNDRLVVQDVSTFKVLADPIPGLTDGNPHHLIFTWDGAGNGLFYVDGVSVAATTSGAINPTFPTFVDAQIGFSNYNPATMIGDEFALYQTELTPTQVADHYAAGLVDFATYVPAVLADAPEVYYHLNDDFGSGRQPSLIVNNGTTELEAIPTGFPAVTTPGPYEYSWQPDLNADTQSTDGTLTTVAIPRLLLPAGYTVGTRTLDLQPSDQWSNVTLWWDDAYQQATDPMNAYRFPGPIKLVYQQRRVSS